MSATFLAIELRDPVRLFDIVMSLPLFPYPPDAATERLEWLTDVIEAYDGTEQRTRVREAPRQFFDYRHPVQAAEYARSSNLLRESRAAVWLVPVWAEAQTIGALAPTATVTMDTATTDLRVGEQVLLWESPRNWEAAVILAVGIGAITLEQPTATTFTHAQVMPVRYGRLAVDPQRDTNSHTARWNLSWQIEENIALATSAPTQFLGDDLDFPEFLRPGESIQDGLKRRVETTDFELGDFAYRSPWDASRLARPYHALVADRAALWTYRVWLHRRAGRFRPFWTASRDSDLRLRSTGTIVSALLVDTDDYFADRPHLAFALTDGTWVVRTVTGASVAGAGTTQLILDTALNIPASTIRWISYLGLTRLDADAVEIAYLHGGAARATVRMLELNP